MYKTPQIEEVPNLELNVIIFQSINRELRHQQLPVAEGKTTEETTVTLGAHRVRKALQ